jgi:DNA-directed RNA polymerase specialized sigma24 family protein
VRRAGRLFADELSQAVGRRQWLGRKQRHWIKAKVKGFIREKTSPKHASALLDYTTSSYFEVANLQEAKEILAQALSELAASGLLTQSVEEQLSHAEALYGKVGELKSSGASESKGFEKLGRKRTDFSKFFDAAKLTKRQRECASLRWEYGRGVTEIAQRLDVHHSTVQEHLRLAELKLGKAKGKPGSTPPT